MAHDFKSFPELTNSQMQIYYFDSPHKQIIENFEARVVKVTDGDTIRVITDFRDFDFPIRMANLAAPERKERGGEASKKWLESEILNKDIYVVLSQERVEKWGRLLAFIKFRGMDISKLSHIMGHGVPWANRKDRAIPNFDREMKKWAFP